MLYTYTENLIFMKMGQYWKHPLRISPPFKEYLIKTTATLRLEFRQILKIDNLQDLTSLTRLFLDNNFIEKITGLEFLSNLVWLDLSFNKIRKIDGLSSQKNLQVLALYQNEIKVRSIYFLAISISPSGVVIRQSSGSHQAVIRQSSGSRLSNSLDRRNNKY
jgi:hypothetical protein